jgi:hypothetical protein
MVYWCTNERGVSRSNKVGKVAKRPAKCGPLFRLSGQQKQQKGKVYFWSPNYHESPFLSLNSKTGQTSSSTFETVQI